MVTTKKRFWKQIQLFLAAIALLWQAGCTPTGPHAFSRGKKLMEQGKYAQAAALFQRAVESPLLATNAQAWNYLGLAYHEAGQPADAIDAYQTALKFNHDLVIVHYNLGCLLLEQNRPDTLESAQNELTAFTLRQGNSADGWVKLGAAQLRLSRLPAAEVSFKKALSLDPRNFEALNNEGVIQLQHRRVRDAAGYFNAALKIQPAYGPALQNLAVAELYLGNRQLALQKYQEYLAITPRPANWDAINELTQQLDAELNPSTRPAITESNVPTVISNSIVRVVPPATNSARPEPVVPIARVTPSSPARQGQLISPAPQRRQEPIAVSETPVVIVADDGNKNSNGSSNSVGEGVPLKSITTAPQVLTVVHYPYLTTGAPPAGNRAEAEKQLAKGLAAARDHRTKDAEGFYRMAAQLDPSFLDAQMSLGAAAFDLGEMSQSLRGYELAVIIDPGSFNARYGFALALKKANYIWDAAEQLERLAGNSTGQTPSQMTAVHLTLGNLYADQFHQNAAARKHYLRVLELDPHNPQAAAIRYWLQQNS